MDAGSRRVVCGPAFHRQRLRLTRKEWEVYMNKGNPERRAPAHAVPAHAASGKAKRPRGRKPHGKGFKGVMIALIALLSIFGLLFILLGSYIGVMINRVTFHGEVSDEYVDSIVPDDIDPDASYDESDVLSDYTFIDASATEVAKIPVRGNTKNVTNYLLIGVDGRGDSYAARSDTTIILTINKENKTIKLTSLMRDIMVTIPGRDKNGDGKDDYGKFNWAYAFGGFDLMQKTIEQNFRLKIDKYIAVNFSAFENAVDALGGVDIALTDAELAEVTRTSSRPSSTSTSGVYHLNGAQSLAYSRIRSLDSDFGRNNRQRKMIQAMFSRAKSMNIGQLNTLLNTVLPQVRTNMTPNELTGFALNSVTYFSYDMKETYYLPQSGTYTSKIDPSIGWVMLFNDPVKAITDLHKFIYSLE